jgi:hypothetical protein
MSGFDGNHVRHSQVATRAPVAQNFIEMCDKTASHLFIPDPSPFLLPAFPTPKLLAARDARMVFSSPASLLLGWYY